MSRRVVLIPGTWAFKGDLAWEERDLSRPLDWFEPGHPFRIFLQAHDLDPLAFTWDGDVGGVGIGDRDLRGWRAWGLALHAFVVPSLCPQMRIPGDELILVSHSHGGQVAAAALAAGLKAAAWLDVASPVRRDAGMVDIYRRARANVQQWTHLYGGTKDRWQIRGAWDLGNPLNFFKVSRENTHAHRNYQISVDADHDDYLQDERYYHYLADLIQTAPAYPVRGGLTPDAA